MSWVSDVKKHIIHKKSDTKMEGLDQLDIAIQSALILFAMSSNLEWTRYIMDFAEIKIPQNILNTALSLASETRHPALVELLLQANADPNSP